MMEDLKEAIVAKERELNKLKGQLADLEVNQQVDVDNDSAVQSKLSHAEIARYSRQLILPELGVTGQLKLANAKVLIVGCGGLGCPAAVYLAAAGLGTIGLLDYDEVEISNLHRQVLHKEATIGVSKSASLSSSITSLNSHINVKQHKTVLNSTTAMEAIRLYDVVLDCTDNVATRYLLNDACVLLNKVLVSGAALRFEGQLTVYNYNCGPCYRCLFPSPPPPETVTNCSDGGVMGVVPGIIGSMQALEAIKIVTDIGTPLSSSMILFDAFSSSFRKVKLRSKQANCAVCGDNPTITKLIDYEQFCGSKAEDKDAPARILENSDRLTVLEYDNISNCEPHVLIDVRQPVELGICSLPGAINIPLKELTTDENIDRIKATLEERKSHMVICLCRRGNDSQRAVASLRGALGGEYEIKDVMGGLTSWAKKIDPSMPIY